MNFYEKIVSFINAIKDLFTLPEWHVNFTAAISFINFVLYFVPKGTIFAIFAFWISVNIISFIIKSITVTWDLVPVA